MHVDDVALIVVTAATAEKLLTLLQEPDDSKLSAADLDRLAYRRLVRKVAVFDGRADHADVSLKVAFRLSEPSSFDQHLGLGLFNIRQRSLHLDG